MTTRDPMYSQSELQPGSWLAGWRNYHQGTCHALGLWELALTGNLTGNSMTSSSSVGKGEPVHTIHTYASKRHLKSPRRPRKAPKWLVLSMLRLSGPLFVHMCVHMYIHMHIRTYIHTYIHTYIPTNTITTRELAGWLAGGITTREPVLRLAGWLAGGLAGWLPEAQRGPERPRTEEHGQNKPVMRLGGGSPQAD